MRFVRLYVARVSPEACRPDACRSMVWLRFWSPSITRVRSQLFLWYASSTGPVGPTRVVVGFRRGGRDLFCSALCLRVRLTRVVRLCVARVSPEARRPDACRSMDLVVKEVCSFIEGKGREGKCNALPLRVSI